MKNRLIYILITLMLISLIGIIVIQGNWIFNAIQERENEFSAHINDALNKVNYDIDEDEAIHFIEHSFGGVDSLLEDVIVIEDKIEEEVNSEVIIVNSDKHSDNHLKIQLNSLSALDSLDQTIDEFEHSIEIISEDLEDLEGLEDLIDLESLSHRLEVKMKLVDSALSANFEVEMDKDHKLEKITSVIEHFTFENLLSGELEDRITKKSLEEKLEKALDNEGIASDFSFAVYNSDEDEYEEGFTSTGFDKATDNKLYKKQLFPSDRINESTYELNVYFENQDSFVWDKVRPMLLLSVLFTILIFITFGYSLYFIFKQKKISRIKNDFINNMTHELKTPLASISLAAASIKHPQVIDKKEEVEHFVEIIESEKQRINSHIEQVLDIAALDTGDLKLNFATTDLIQIINYSLKNVDLSLSQSDGTVTFDHSLETAPLLGDEFHLTNVVTNILDNSIKYAKEDLSITISLKEKEGSYQIIITDNGIGMNKTSQKLAFDKFYRAESGNIHTRKGFGLGLSYVKSIVEAHQGKVELTSQLDKGTVVNITLPKTS